MRRSRSVLSRRKVLKAGLAGAAGAVLSTWPRRSASGQTKLAAASSSPVPAGQKYEVTFLTTQTNPADVKIYQALGSRFTESNPNITVKIT
ncbi:MAG TPA: twin-arginine translocation signal domain-containing protein, partial [bacterium]|nr:twin-arginine translocation signal domain-containing protein [bacterium]